MPRPTGPTNPVSIKTINALEKASRLAGARIWADVAERLRKPRRSRIEVNLWKIDKLTAPNDVVVIPGKVLGEGRLTKPVTVAALTFSESAKKKIAEAGGRALSLVELAQENPKGSGVKIIA
uniref:Large ribosomal subunit protein eL18 n=1 Tax=uncultured korarchaeote TaxID=161241 RepID=A0A1L2JK62_9CREN|nr:ribosomal protein L18E [uncultured korarchaeote]